MNWLLTNALSALLLPPLNLLLLLLIGMALLKTRPQFARGLLWFTIITLWLLSTPLVGRALLQSLEQNPPLDLHQSNAQAIIVLGAGRYHNSPEYGTDTISQYTLERTRYAAYIARNTLLPVLTSGGDPEEAGASEAALMKAVLEQDFHIPVKWLEDRSNDTADETQQCWKILAPLGIKKIALITHAWHMPRAKLAFIEAGFEVTPAPVAFTTTARLNILHWLPNTEGLSQTRQAMHEWIGIFWYWLRDEI